jgi:hypothetical protein
MTTLTEAATFDATVYQLATTDPVQGGAGGISNTQAQSLADRTRYLKVHMDAAEANIATLFTQVATLPTTQAAGDESGNPATTAFVHRNSGGVVSINVAGNSNVTLTADQWGVNEIIFTGALTGDINIIFPTRGDRWMTANRTSGLFKITCKTAAGAGVKVAQGRSKGIWCDGVDILNEETDLSTRARTVTVATTLAAGDDVFADQAGGAFALTLPLNPSEGDRCRISGNFATSAMTVSRNGQSIRDVNGTPQVADYVINRNAASAIFSFMEGAWQVTVG